MEVLRIFTSVAILFLLVELSFQDEFQKLISNCELRVEPDAVDSQANNGSDIGYKAQSSAECPMKDVPGQTGLRVRYKCCGTTCDCKKDFGYFEDRGTCKVCSYLGESCGVIKACCIGDPFKLNKKSGKYLPVLPKPQPHCVQGTCELCFAETEPCGPGFPCCGTEKAEFELLPKANDEFTFLLKVKESKCVQGPSTADDAYTCTSRIPLPTPPEPPAESALPSPPPSQPHSPKPQRPGKPKPKPRVACDGIGYDRQEIFCKCPEKPGRRQKIGFVWDENNDCVECGLNRGTCSGSMKCCDGHTCSDSGKCTKDKCLEDGQVAERKRSCRRVTCCSDSSECRVKDREVSCEPMSAQDID